MPSLLFSSIKKIRASLVSLLVSLILFSNSIPAYADVALETPPQPGTGPSTLQEIIESLDRILLWASRVFWILAIGFILYAGFLYLTAAGSDDRLKTAKKQLWYAVIAVAIALMATTIPTLIQSIF